MQVGGAQMDLPGEMFGLLSVFEMQFDVMGVGTKAPSPKL